LDDFHGLLTTDLCDAHEDKVRVVEPMFSSFGGRDSFHGRIATLKLFEDNSLVARPSNLRVKDAYWSSMAEAACAGRWSAISWPHSPSRTAGPASSSMAASAIRGPSAKWISACSRLTRTR
jgi:hypothetical protein